MSISVVRTTLMGSVFFLPDAVGEPGEIMALDFTANGYGQPLKIIDIEPHLFEMGAKPVRVYKFDGPQPILLDGWAGLARAKLTEADVLILVRPEHWVDLHCHGDLLSVVGGTPTVAEGGVATSRSPGGQP